MPINPITTSLHPREEGKSLALQRIQRDFRLVQLMNYWIRCSTFRQSFLKIRVSLSHLSGMLAWELNQPNNSVTSQTWHTYNTCSATAQPPGLVWGPKRFIQWCLRQVSYCKLRICRSVRFVSINFDAFWGVVQGWCADGISGLHRVTKATHCKTMAFWALCCRSAFGKWSVCSMGEPCHWYHSACGVETLAGTKLLT